MDYRVLRCAAVPDSLVDSRGLDLFIKSNRMTENVYAMRGRQIMKGHIIAWR